MLNGWQIHPSSMLQKEEPRYCRSLVLFFGSLALGDHSEMRSSCEYC